MAPPCSQQQLAAAGPFLRWKLMNLHCFLLINKQLINWFSITYLQAYQGNDWNSTHRLSLASHLAPLRSQQQLAAAGILWRWVIINLSCFQAIYSQHFNFFQLNIYMPTMETAETQPTDWVWRPAWHHHAANINWQRWIYFKGTSLHFQSLSSLPNTSKVDIWVP